QAADVSLTSWNGEEKAVDRRTADGRAYIRLLGGHASLSHAHISDLGFWSGNTGGPSLTGTDTVSTFDDEPAPPAHAEDAAEAGARLLPEDQLTALAAETGEDYSVVTAGIKNVTIEDNAFGLFLTNARDVAIQDTAISGSLVDGLVLHRFVTDAEITRTSSTDNFVDGFALGRSTTRVVLKDSTAEGNGRNGISLDGRPLADGPNAVGTAVQIYGGNRIIESTFEDNKRYGIEISGGRNLEVRGNMIVKNYVGVVVSHGAERVDVFANNLRDQVQQSIAIREAGDSTSVRHNDIRGGDTGIYVRNAGAAVSGNTLQSISNHGITLRGDVRGTTVASNVVSGFGSSAVWDEESSGAAIGENDLLGWRPAYTFERAVNFVFQPLTFVWLLLGGLLLVTAVSGQRKRQDRTIRSPYAERVPLTSLSKGIVSLDDVGQRR
ncbi:MAG TPA: right-handed parallel beta-helix repeat-containing protein, partial [Arthrobacter sp.]|nr:right-handed parallel beta-helix repeat-containing protein [Arthrobacter sp.]